MNNEFARPSRLRMLINLALLAVSVWGISIKSYKSGDVSFFEKAVLETIAPLQKGTFSLKERFLYVFDHYLWLINTSKENEALRQRVKVMQNEIFSMKEISRENQRLKALLKFGETIPRQKVMAQIIGRDSSSYFKVLRINKGTNHGIKEKYPVVNFDGVVGYIYRVSANYADILTILDTNNRVDSIIARTRTHGIVEGDKGGVCRMKYVTRTEKVVQGDEVITAGLGDIYPKGLKLGTISKIEKESYGITQVVRVTPTVDFTHLEEVMVLLPKAKTSRSLSLEDKK